MDTAKLSRVVRKLRECELTLVDAHRELTLLAEPQLLPVANKIEAATLTIDSIANSLNDRIRLPIGEGGANGQS